MPKKGNKSAASQVRFNVYVVELEPAVLTHRRFREANPQHIPDKACLYVGMTSLNPEERFKNHKSGIKAAAYVKRYGKWLRRRLYERLNPMSYEDAKGMEVALAERLRGRGYAVWQK
jgi:predicted GIY-YIG superfamily endonuclease